MFLSFVKKNFVFLLLGASLQAAPIQEMTSPIATASLSATPNPSPSPAPAVMEPIAATVGRILEQGHFLRLPLNDPNPPHDPETPALSMTARVMKNYLQILDYSHLYFIQSDIDEFEQKYGPTLSTDVLRGDLSAARAIYDRFRQRVEDRVAKVKILTAKKYEFSSNRTIELNRQKSPWPKDEAEADQLWHDRIKAELLQERLNKHATDSPMKIVSHRYQQMLKYLHEQTDEEAIKTFLVALSESYDPHSEYMSPSDMENFNIQMRLSLVGIGALLRPDDGYTRIVEVMPGGPADKDGRLKANDRIAAVAQGNGPFEDIIDLRIDKVVEKIRGKKGTPVRLQVIPAHATDPSKRIIITLTRDEVKLKESEVKAEVIDIPETNGAQERFGWLTIPSFYSEMDKHGNEDAKSTTKDVRRLLTRLKKENIQGLVIDLRRNGGGSLEEVINLTGLFIGPGPVVQVKDSSGKIAVSANNEPAPFYDGPIVVLINRLSASASEIFAAALQDYHRAVIVGDERTFGKGTVQTLLDVGRFLPSSLFGSNQKAGSMKLTIQKFYRVSGGSTQYHGVSSDIQLPSLTDNPEIGEGMLPNPLVYDEVAPLKITPPSPATLFIETLKQRSGDRVKKDLEFHYIAENMKKLSEKLKLNTLSLNKELRQKELKQEKKEIAQHKAERLLCPQPALLEYEITLDNVDQPTLSKFVPKKKPEKDPKDKKATSKDASDIDDDVDDSEDDPNFVDPEKREALAIINDLSTLQAASKALPVAASVAH
ncbi:MAG: carboxy terminal-processing peptidase [Chthoniobacterales bacterium]|nr:carboxy terminal-processing peptidase [Chthoniobacterales bacterium]